MSIYQRDSYRTNNEENKKRSSIQMKQNILNYFTKANTRNKIKKIASLNDKKTEIIKENKKEDFFKDFEKKAKARRSLLYLLNIKSGGTYYPQIIEYFKQIKKSKMKEDFFKEIKENNIQESNNYLIIKSNDSSQDTKIRSKFYPYKTAINNLSHEKNEINELKENFNENKNITKDNNELNFNNKRTDNIIDNIEIKNTSQENNEINNNKIKKFPIDKMIMEKITTYNNNIKINSNKNKNKSRKKSFKKHIKRNKIDMIFNEQRNELQKSGNYHLSLRTAIQSSLGKKKFKHKKK